MSYLDYYKGKRVLLTGHTGFKGSWMSRVLVNAEAELIGYSRCTKKDPSLFELAGVKDRMVSIAGDVRDLEHLKQVFADYRPEVVLHMAAQPIVRESYVNPVYTYETNVLGTVNLLECVRLTDSVKSVLNVTTDRAGNVIGGGDFAKDRIIPDCVRAARAGAPIGVRNPYSTRPYQHVLEPVLAYLMIAARQAEDHALAGWYNVGPDDCDCVSTGELVSLFCEKWGEGLCWENRAEANAPHEANFLKLDCAKIKSVFGWRPTWHMEETMAQICAWTRVWMAGGDIQAEMDREIKAFLEGEA